MSRMLRVSEESGLAGAWDCSGAGRALPGGRSVVDHLAPSLQGVITVKGLVDREKGDFYTLTVVADDGGPKVDSTVVSRSPGKNPTGSLITTPSHLQTHIFTGHPKCRWTRVSVAQRQCCSWSCHTL